MRLNYYLNETTEVPCNDIDRLIAQRCKPWLKASLGEFIFRGAKNKPDCYRASVRSDRIPVDTTLEVQDIFDNVINAKYGFKPRSNGLFVTGDMSEAARYGSIYKIYPLGKFSFLWSPTIKDFYSEVRSIVRQFVIDNIHGKADIKKYSEILGKRYTKDGTLELPEVQEQLKKKILDAYTNKNLVQAIDSRKEIMLVTKEFYAT